MSFDDEPWSTPKPPAGGFPPPPGGRRCPSCGQMQTGYGSLCAYCGYGSQGGGPGERSRLAAGLLGILLPFGVHSFYLGDNKKGALQLVLTLFTCGLVSLWSFIEGIMILAGSINVDADGRPLAK